MIDRKLKKEVREVIARKAEQWINGIEANVENKMEKALLSFLGLEKDYYREYQIDHCNGRNSVFIDILRNKAQKEAEKIIGKIGKLRSDDDIKQFKDAFKKEYNSCFRREISELARKKAKEDAVEYIETYFEKELKKKIFN